MSAIMGNGDIVSKKKDLKLSIEIRQGKSMENAIN